MAAERTMVERWMDWLLGALNTPYVAVFRDQGSLRARNHGLHSGQAVLSASTARQAHRKH
jgi:hypothetical protein